MSENTCTVIEELTEVCNDVEYLETSEKQKEFHRPVIDIMQLNDGKEMRHGMQFCTSSILKVILYAKILLFNTLMWTVYVFEK